VTGPDRPMAHAAVGDPPFVRQTALAGPAPAVVAATGDRTGWWSARLGALLADPRGEVDA
jgi:hypothetical protein